MAEYPGNGITVVLPAYNERDTIALMIESAKKHADAVIVVDDGSRDGTADIAFSAGARVIRIPENSGKGHALSIGLTTAALDGSKVIVCLDSDGQHDPEDIPRLAQPILNGTAEMVIGSRFLNPASIALIPKYRRVGQRMLTIATNAGNNMRVTDSQSGYRAFKKEILESFDYSSKGMGIESEMVRTAVEKGYRIEEVPVAAKYEGLDTSTYRPMNHGFSVFASILRVMRDEHPLLLFGFSGLILIILGIFTGVYALAHLIRYDELLILPSILSVMMFALGGMSAIAGLILNAISTHGPSKR